MQVTMPNSMNIVDIGILGIILISVLISMYYGFTVSLFNIASYFISWFFSLVLHPSLSRAITERFPDVLEKIIYYSEGSSKTVFSDRMLPVTSLSPEKITELVRKSGLPNPFSRNLIYNLTHKSLDNLTTTGEYFDYTVANIIMNLISFILIFIALQLLFMLIISIVRNITNLPILKKFDSFSAGVLGFFRGILFVFIAFAFIPLLYLVVTADFLAIFFEGSNLTNFFLDFNIFTLFVKGVF